MTASDRRGRGSWTHRGEFREPPSGGSRAILGNAGRRRGSDSCHRRRQPDNGDRAEQALLDLLMGSDLERGPGDFYDRVCKSICVSTPFTRAVFLAWDSGYGAVLLPAGSHGVDKDLLARIEGSLDETPIAQRVFAENRVIVVSGKLSGHVPARYAEIVDEETLACARSRRVASGLASSSPTAPTPTPRSATRT